MPNDIVQAHENPAAIMERVIIHGDLSKLNAQERTSYYMQVCSSMGLNPLSRPLEYIKLNGKDVLYAKRDAADQLRKINGISLQIARQEQVGDLYIVTVEAKDKTGRVDSDMGAVNVKGLSGEALANAMLKGVTKAKRRVTLSISGLGFLDETEVEDIPAATAARVQPTALPAPQQQKAPPARPYAMVNTYGEEITFELAGEYIAGLEQEFETADAPGKVGLWDSNAQTFQTWQTKAMRMAERDPKAKAVADEFCRLGKHIADTVHQLTEQAA